MARPEIAQFVQVLRSEEFKGILSALPGYGNAITGEVFDVESALRPARLPAQTAKP